MKKVILFSIDGMRPDGLLQCGNPYVKELLSRGQFTLEGKTVFPSITLPCHTSLFYSLPPERHGITDNQYAPQVHPVNGLTTCIKNAGGVSAMFYGWEPIRDVARPLDMVVSEFRRARSFEGGTDDYLTDRAILCLRELRPDFLFLYQVNTDELGGHDHGWMSPEYLDYLSRAVSNVKRVLDEFGDEYTAVILADHGGHDRLHRTGLPEDMTIPIIGVGPEFTPGARFENASILDVAPTIAKIMGVLPDEEWEGRPLI